MYEFVQQAFLQAYVAAWKKYAEASGDEPRKQFLVIEEIIIKIVIKIIIEIVKEIWCEV